MKRISNLWLRLTAYTNITRYYILGKRGKNEYELADCNRHLKPFGKLHACCSIKISIKTINPYMSAASGDI
jgi:hypothetical protein